MEHLRHDRTRSNVPRGAETICSQRISGIRVRSGSNGGQVRRGQDLQQPCFRRFFEASAVGVPGPADGSTTGQRGLERSGNAGAGDGRGRRMRWEQDSSIRNDAPHRCLIENLVHQIAVGQQRASFRQRSTASYTSPQYPAGSTRRNPTYRQPARVVTFPVTD